MKEKSKVAMAGLLKKAGRLIIPAAGALLCSGMLAVSGIIPGSAMNAGATDEKQISGLGTGTMTNPEDPGPVEGGPNVHWNGTYLYYGSYMEDGYEFPMVFRVLSVKTNDFGGTTMLLDSETKSGSMKFNSTASNSWINSDVCRWLNGTYLTQYFTEVERTAIAQSFKRTPAEEDGAGNEPYGLVFQPLGGERVFLLDAKECTRRSYGFHYGRGQSGLRRKYSSSNGYWLRSPKSDDPTKEGVVSKPGDISYTPVNDPGAEQVDVYAAFNIDLKNVISSTLFRVSADHGGGVNCPEYKLTILDKNMTIASTGVSKAGTAVTVPYAISGSDAANATQVSVIMTDGTWTENGWSDGAALKFYKKLAMSGNPGTSGTGTFELPADYDAGWHTYILAEDVNWSRFREPLTDYASAPVEIAMTEKPAQDDQKKEEEKKEEEKKPEEQKKEEEKKEEQPADTGKVRAFVERIYTIMLGRAGDAAGIDDWTNKLLTKEKTGAEVAQGFVMSDELKNQDISDEEFVLRLYRTFFDSDGDEAGRAYWLGELKKGHSRKFVFRGFAESAQFSELCGNFGIERGKVSLSEKDQECSDDNLHIDRAKVEQYVDRLFLTILGREGDPAGRQYWIDRIMNREENAASVAMRGFFHSDEYKKANKSDTEFTKDLYRSMMGREADAGGLAYWEEQLQSGAYTRDRMIEVGFGNSKEFREILQSFGLKKLD